MRARNRDVVVRSSVNGRGEHTRVGVVQRLARERARAPHSLQILQGCRKNKPGPLPDHAFGSAIDRYGGARLRAARHDGAEFALRFTCA